MLAALVWAALAQVPAPAIAGTVVGPRGEPVAGATLVAVDGGGLIPEVTTRGRSDAAGRFVLDRPRPVVDVGLPDLARLWAFAPGFRLTHLRTPAPGEAVVVRLDAPGRAVLRAVGPDSRPAAGARVLPLRLKGGWHTIPDAIAELAAGVADADGRTVIDAVAASDLAYVDVQSGKWGVQGQVIEPDPDGGPALVHLRPVAAWSGRLAADNPADAAGWRVRAWTSPPFERDAPPRTTGSAEVTTDAEGRFAVASIAVGQVALEFVPPDNRPLLPEPPQGLIVRAGVAEPATIPLRRGNVVTGRIVERGTDRGVGGVGAYLYQKVGTRGGGQNTATGPDGRFRFLTLPGLVNVSGGHLRDGYAWAGRQDWDDFTVPEPPHAVDLGTREVIAAARALAGRVVDEAGRPVAGARIAATWQAQHSGTIRAGTIQAQADAAGEFALGGLTPETTVEVTATRGGRASTAAVRATAGQAGPVAVVILPKPVFAVVGRLVGPDGRGLGGLGFKVERRRVENNHASFGMPVAFDEVTPFRTEPDGTFRTPPELDRQPAEIQVEVDAPGYLPARTGWLAAPTAGEELPFPDLVVRRLRGVREVVGRVLDGAGNPVAGATLRPGGAAIAGTFARADAEGRFRLAGVPTGPALLTAEADGFRFGGAVVGPGSDPVAVRLARATGPPIARPATLPPPLTRAEERALGRGWLAPVVPRAQDGSLGFDGKRVIPALARLDPERVLTLIEDRAVAEPLPALLAAALGQFEDDPARAIATVEDDRDPADRAAAWLALEAYRPAPDGARRVDLLDRALRDARAGEDDAKPVGQFGDPAGEQRFDQLAEIADRWLDLGQPRRATRVILEAQRLLATFPPERRPTNAEWFGEVLAAVYLPAAKALFERRGAKYMVPADAETIARHNIRAATRLAALDPAAAERLIGPPFSTFYQRTGALLTIARRMAPVDLPRARAVVARLGDRDERRPGVGALVPYGLGRVAGAVAATNPSQARRLLDEAYDGLRRAAAELPGAVGPEAPANLMAELLPVVERVDPDTLAERTWLALSLAPALARNPSWDQVQGFTTLGLLVGRYDRGMADALLDPVLDRLPDLLAGVHDSPYNLHETIIRELAAYDPRAIDPLLRSLPEHARCPPPVRANYPKTGSVESIIRLGAAESLGVPPAARAYRAGRIGAGDPDFRVDE